MTSHRICSNAHVWRIVPSLKWGEGRAKEPIVHLSYAPDPYRNYTFNMLLRSGMFHGQSPSTIIYDSAYADLMAGTKLDELSTLEKEAEHDRTRTRKVLVLQRWIAHNWCLTKALSDSEPCYLSWEARHHDREHRLGVKWLTYFEHNEYQ